MNTVTDYYNIIRLNRNELVKNPFQKLPNEIIKNIFEYVKEDFMKKINKNYLRLKVENFIKKIKESKQSYKYYQYNYLVGENSEYVRTIFKFTYKKIPYKILDSLDLEKIISMYFAVNNFSCRYSHHYKLPDHGVAFLITKLLPNKYKNIKEIV